MNVIARDIDSFTRHKYHIFLDNGDNYEHKCLPGWKIPKNTFETEYFKVVAHGDNIVDLPVRLLCGNCFSVRNETVRVSANGGRIL